MKKIFFILSLSTITTAFAQQRDTTRHKESDHHRMMRSIGQRLSMDSVKANQVLAIQDNYKAAIKQLMSNSGLTEEQKRRAVDSLINKKNNSLSTILTPEQQVKFIPSTERNKNRTNNKRPQQPNGH